MVLAMLMKVDKNRLIQWLKCLKNNIRPIIPKNEKIVEKFFIYSKNIVFKRLTPIANGGKIVKLRIKD